jgi:hypothetical protein
MKDCIELIVGFIIWCIIKPIIIFGAGLAVGS